MKHVEVWKISKNFIKLNQTFN